MLEPAASSEAGSVEPSALLGQWNLTRELSDQVAGLTGTAKGLLTLRAAGDQIEWLEQGTLLWNGSQLPFTRSYVLRQTEDGWWVYFGDGGPFHPWRTGQRLQHPCSEDTYDGLITVTSADAWVTRWDVSGPGTSQRIATQLSRVSPRIAGP